MAILVDWVKQTVSGTPGAGDITLGSAVSGFIRFQDDTRISDGSIVYYTIEDGANRERGIGTYSTTGPTLTRTAIHAKIESGTYSENPGTGLSLTSAAIVSCSAIADMHNFKGALVYHNTTQSINNSTDTVCLFNSEIYDTNGFHDVSTNTSRFTIPAGVSFIRLTAGVRFGANATGIRQACFLKNGSLPTPNAFVRVDIDASTEHSLNFSSPIFSCVEGDYFEVIAFQSSGGALNISTSTNGHFFQIEVIE